MKLIKRLDANNKFDRLMMLIYANLMNLPYVKEDLVEYMEFWLIEATMDIKVGLVCMDKELAFETVPATIPIIT